jgi:hypothetical protein
VETSLTALWLLILVVGIPLLAFLVQRLVSPGALMVAVVRKPQVAEDKEQR